MKTTNVEQFPATLKMSVYGTWNAKHENKKNEDRQIIEIKTLLLDSILSVITDECKCPYNSINAYVIVRGMLAEFNVIWCIFTETHFAFEHRFLIIPQCEKSTRHCL